MGSPLYCGHLLPTSCVRTELCGPWPDGVHAHQSASQGLEQSAQLSLSSELLSCLHACWPPHLYNAVTAQPLTAMLRPGCAAQKPARILRPSPHWDSNLDWCTEDVLQLTLGEGEVQWELKGSDVLSMSMDDIKPTWKVRTLSRIRKTSLIVPLCGTSSVWPAEASVAQAE